MSEDEHGGQNNKGSAFKQAAVIGAAITAAGAVIAAAINIVPGLLDGGKTAEAKPTPPVFASSPTAPSAGASAASPTGTEPSPEPDTSGTDPAAEGETAGGDGADAAPSVQYLADIEATREQSATLVREGRQTRCLTSLMIPAHIFQSEQTLEFQIEPGWDTFRTLAGIDTAPPSGNVMRFTVYVDDEREAVYELSDRQSKEIVVPVTGKSNLKLVTDTVKAGGTPKGGYGAWGDARFTKGPQPDSDC